MTKHTKQERDPLFMPTRAPGTSAEAYAESVRQAANRQHRALNRGGETAQKYAVPRSPWEKDDGAEATAENRQPPTKKAFVTLRSNGASTGTYI